MNDALTILRALAHIIDAGGTITLTADSVLMTDIRFCLAEAARAEAEAISRAREADEYDDTWESML